MQFEPKEFRNRIDEFEKKRGCRVTAQAADLLINTVGAIESDPHPHWLVAEITQRDHTAYFRGHFSELLEKIRWSTSIRNHRIQSKRGIETAKFCEVITYFDALHWLGDNLDKICPFSK